MRALHSPAPRLSKNKKKYHMGHLDHLKIDRRTQSGAFYRLEFFVDPIRLPRLQISKAFKGG